MVSPAPRQLRLRMYNVGFGDCFLLSFTYAKPLPAPGGQSTVRHVLIDFGTTRRARSRLAPKAVADLVKADCGGRLDALVMSHRHKDHLSGFGTAATKNVIAELEPGLVVRPWTEDPKLAADAGQPGVTGLAADGQRAADRALLAALRDGEAMADQIVKRASAAGRGGRTSLVQFATDEVANPNAIAELDELSKGGRGEYLSAGMDTKLAELLPGVDIRVLGPPLPSQWEPVSRQAEDSEEYWLTSRRQIRRLFPSGAGKSNVPLGTSRWIMDQLLGDEQRQLMSLVRWLDDAMNNTSLILTFSTGEHTLLFGGDAQIENWGFALDQAKSDAGLRALLESVDLYKVGHHGSRNGTPISLFKMWAESADARPFVSMMSTKEGVHGDSEAGAVPRSTLVTALKDHGQLLSTDDGLSDWIEVQASLPGGAYEVKHAPLH